jgi:predicted DNA-binding antitoxin AbrB/MazE fold protein
MPTQIDVIFENGVFKPLMPVPSLLKDRQRLTITIEEANVSADWLADANDKVRSTPSTEQGEGKRNRTRGRRA